MWQRLVVAEPANIGWQRDLSITRQKIEGLRAAPKGGGYLAVLAQR